MSSGDREYPILTASKCVCRTDRAVRDGEPAVAIMSMGLRARPSGFIVLAAAGIVLCGHPGAAEIKKPATPALKNDLPVCADFLAKVGKKPPSLEFLECRKVVAYGLAALESNYRVKGADAVASEAYLVKISHIPRLRFICCGWDSFPIGSSPKSRYGDLKMDGREYEISMSSEETLEKRWKEIPFFYVRVTVYLEEP